MALSRDLGGAAGAAARIRTERLERIRNIFCGALLYGAEAALETLDPPARSESSPLKHFKKCVREVVAITGQRNMLKSQAVSRDDRQILHLETQQWLEAIDPQHRAGGDLKHYFRAWEASATNLDFFDWLDHGDGRWEDLPECPRSTLDAGAVHYCTLVEREALAVSADTGLMRWKKSGELVSGNLIFVVSTKGQMFMSQKVRGRFHHSSFLAGNPVCVSGTVVMEAGRFVRLMPYSGHYRPKPGHFEELIDLLKRQGLSADQANVLVSEICHPDFFDKSKRPKSIRDAEAVELTIAATNA